MAVTEGPRIGLTRWSDSDTDPLTREQLDGDNAALEELAALDAQGLLAERPPAGTRGLYFYATDARVLFRDDGVRWRTAGGGAGGGNSTRAFSFTLMGA